MARKNRSACHTAISTLTSIRRCDSVLAQIAFKMGETKNTRYKAVPNHRKQELAEYCGTAIVSARVERLKDKLNVKGAVIFASTRILTTLRKEI